MDKPKIYFDNAATTQLHPDALMAMMPYLTDRFGNPSGGHYYSNTASKAIGEARRQVAQAINAKPEEIYFTGGGTEADNWAIKGAAESRSGQGRHIITSAIEHHAVLYTCKYLEKQGWSVTYLPVDEEGFVSPEAVEKAIRPDTVLVSIMLANNEIGTIQPLAAIGEITRKHGIWLHTDAVQAVGHIPVDVEALNVDMLTLSAHKFYGPKGVGALYLRKGLKITPLLHGGAQEKEKRAGTENVAGIVGMGEALTITMSEMEAESTRVAALRDKLIRVVEECIPNVRLNGPRTNRLPGNANFLFSFIEGESIVTLLNMKGVCVSTGSACSSDSLDPSHVIVALGVPQEKANGSIRFTLGRHNTEAEIDALPELLTPIIERLCEMSPLYEDHLKNGGAPWNTAKR